MLKARSVAVVGASERPGSVGDQTIRQLVSGGFDGEVYPVNPRHATVHGLRSWPSLDEVGNRSISRCSRSEMITSKRRWRKPGPGTASDSLRDSLERLLEVFDHPKPVIAQVQGHCLAGEGCDLMMMCDLTVASDDAVFGQPEIRFGSTVVAQVMPG